MPGARQVPEGSGEQGKMEETSCKNICGAQATFAVKGYMLMMLMMMTYLSTLRLWEPVGILDLNIRAVSAV